MTTIATDGKSIASDSQATQYETIVSQQSRKLYRIDKTTIAGVAGNAAAAIAIIKAMQENSPLNRLEWDDVEIVLIDGSDTVKSYCGTHLPLELPVPYEIGSGSSFALAAMKAGKNPKEAVKIAIELDPFSGGKIQQMSVRTTDKPLRSGSTVKPN